MMSYFCGRFPKFASLMMTNVCLFVFVYYSDCNYTIIYVYCILVVVSRDQLVYIYNIVVHKCFYQLYRYGNNSSC